MTLFSNPEFHDHEQVSFFHDAASGLKAIIAIHSTAMGAVSGGGIRMRNYATEDEALVDVLRLSRGMTYKSALAGLPLGGAKSVIIGDPAVDKTPELWAAMARAIESLGGRYIAGEDVGTNTADMDAMGKLTPHVASSIGPNTAPYTALGVYLAMRVAVNNQLGKDDLSRVRVALQGYGKVASLLAELLVRDGAQVYGADVNEVALNAGVEKLGITAVPVADIASLDVDVFAPCALGGILNEHSIPRIRACVVCGAANNQLASPADDLRIHEAGILYMPDYLVNAGGVIAAVASTMRGINDHEGLVAEVERISDSAEAVITLSREQGIPMQLAADRLAESMLAESRARAA